jgi:hypothetical protein
MPLSGWLLLGPSALYYWSVPSLLPSIMMMLVCVWLAAPRTQCPLLFVSSLITSFYHGDASLCWVG